MHEAGWLRYDQAQQWALTTLICLIPFWFHKLKAVVLTFSLLRIAMILQVARNGQAPYLFLYLDLPTQLLNTLPELLMLDLRGMPLLTLLLGHVGASYVFNSAVMGHSALLAVLRGAGIQVVCYGAFWGAKRSIMRAPSFRPMDTTHTSSQGKMYYDQAQPIHRADAQQQERVRLHEGQLDLMQQCAQPARESQCIGASAAQPQQLGHAVEGLGLRIVHGMERLPQRLALCDLPCPVARGDDAANPPTAHVASGGGVSGVAPSPAALGRNEGSKGGIRACRGFGPERRAGSAQRLQLLLSQQGAGVEGGVSGLKRPGGASERSSGGSSRGSSTSCLPLVLSLAQEQSRLLRLGRLRQAVSMPLLSEAEVQEVLVQGAREGRPRQPFTSRLGGPHPGTHVGSLSAYMQEVCRFAVKVNGPSLPVHLPSNAAAQLQLRLGRYQRLMTAEPAAVRSGCLVISFGARGRKQQNMPMDHACGLVAAVAREWAQQHGLLSEGHLLAVQVGTCGRLVAYCTLACNQLTWEGTNSEHLKPRPRSLEFSIALPTPFILAELPGSAPAQAATSTQQQACIPPAPAICSFMLTLMAPPHIHEVRGWRGGVDAPEDLPDDIKSCSASLLACLDDQFVAVAVQQRGVLNKGERLLEVQVCLPVSLVKAEAHCPRALVLELWAAGQLVCSHSALLFPSHLSSAFMELRQLIPSQASSRQELVVQGSATYSQLPIEDAAFVSDLVCWLHYTASASSAAQQQEQQQQQQQYRLPMDMHSNTINVDDQELALMADVGRSLLDHCLCCRMLEVAGLLFNILGASPFGLPINVLLEGPTTDFGRVPLVQNGYQQDIFVPEHLELGQTFQQLVNDAQPGKTPAQHASVSSLRMAAARACVFGFGEALSRNCSSGSGPAKRAGPTKAGFQKLGTCLAVVLADICYLFYAIPTMASLLKEQSLTFSAESTTTSRCPLGALPNSIVFVPTWG